MLLFARFIRIPANVSIFQKGQVDQGSILFAAFPCCQHENRKCCTINNTFRIKGLCFGEIHLRYLSLSLADFAYKIYPLPRVLLMAGKKNYYFELCLI